VRLRTEDRPDIETELQAKQDFLARMRQSPVALVPEMAKLQHYEVPPEFFQKVLGKTSSTADACGRPASAPWMRRRRPCCSFTGVGPSYRTACRFWSWAAVGVADALDGGAVSAEPHHGCLQFGPQGRFIRETAAARGLPNVEVLTADMNDLLPASLRPGGLGGDVRAHAQLAPAARAHPQLLKRDGRLFIHIFTHRRYAYPFDTEGRTIGWAAISFQAA